MLKKFVLILGVTLFVFAFVNNVRTSIENPWAMVTGKVLVKATQIICNDAQNCNFGFDEELVAASGDRECCRLDNQITGFRQSFP